MNEVWEAYARYLCLHRLRDIDTLSACVASAPATTTWATDGLAVAEARDEGSGAYVGLVGGASVGSARGTTLLVRPAIAEAQLETEWRSRGEAPLQLEGVETGDGEVPPDRVRRFYGVVTVDPERLGRDAGRIAEEIVAHLNGLVGTETEITIEVRATNNEGFPDDVVRIVSENAAALRFKNNDFEQS